METKTCTCVQHHNRSQYPKNEVPFEYFQKGNKTYKTCEDCRFYKNKSRKKCVEKNRELFQDSVKSGGDLLICSIKSHINYGSIYPRNEVPIDLFRKEPGNAKSELFSSCKDCRNHTARVQLTRVNTQKIIAEDNNKFCCANCCRHYEMSERAPNKDSTLSVLCINCKSLQNLNCLKLKNTLVTIKMEFIENNKSSCNLCKNLYLKDPINNTAIELTTYTKDNKLYVEFDGKQYETMDFLKSSGMELELDVLQFDHLTEDEQRERGLLLPYEEYVDKKYIVSRATSESAMRLESLKCQLLCGRCHVIETIRRERGLERRSPNESKKLNHTNELKLQGCEICKYKNPDLPRFFEFDHLDPSTKIDAISTMMKFNKYTFDDLIMEISKCRILCRHCHLIHTKIQKKQKNS